MTATFAGYSVSVGFLDGNLGDSYHAVSRADVYAECLEDALSEAFPGAEIEILHQDASGSPPFNFRPAVYTPAGDRDESACDRVQRIVDDVFESGDWL